MSTIKIYDSFARAAGSQDLSTWVSDTLQTWDALAGQYLVDGDILGGVCRETTADNFYKTAVQDLGGVAHAAGDEVFVDFYHAIGHLGGTAFQAIRFQNAAGKDATSYFQLGIQYPDAITNQVVIWANAPGASYDSTIMGTIPGDLQGTRFRIGVKINAANDYLVWYGPADGGARTVLGRWNPTYNPLLDFLGDAAQGYLGVIVYGTSGITGQLPTFDNLTLQTLDPVMPPLTNLITYQRVLNIARNRSKDFQRVVVDDMQIVDELNQLTLELVQEATDADHSSMQEVVNWATDVKPYLNPEPADLTAADDIVLPAWVNTVFAVEGVRSTGTKVTINVERKESEIRDRNDYEGIYTGLLDERLLRPRAWRVWDGTYGVWRLVKDVTSDGGVATWADLVDANIVVAGVRLAMTERPDLTDTIPVPFRGLVPLAEAYALILGSRVNKSVGWMRDQRIVKDKAWERFREYINQSNMSGDEAVDPEIGQGFQ